MKHNIQVLSILILLVLVPFSSDARKTRSDKGGHHHHSAAYYAKKALKSEVKSDTTKSSSTENSSVGKVDTSNLKPGTNDDVSNDEILFCATFLGLGITFFMLGKWLSNRSYKKVFAIENGQHLQWLGEMNDMENQLLRSKEEEVKKWKLEARENIKLRLSDGSVLDDEANQFYGMIEDSNFGYVQDSYDRLIEKANRRVEWRKRYSSEDVENMISGNYWQGMSEEQLIFMRGQPEKIESELLKTKVNKYYIYGSKSSGDVFVFNEGKLERFKDR
jgi:hypothetical protein